MRHWHSDGVAAPITRSPRRSLPERFGRMCAAVVRRLPFGLSSVVAPNLLGYALLNSFTFAVDLLLLTLLHGWLGVPLPIAVTIGYLCAFSLAFVLNRTLNFRSHAPVGRQTVLYVITVAINYGVILLGVTTLLTSLGMQYQLSRLIAGGCEAIFMYCSLRWVVFAQRKEPATPATPDVAA